MKKEDQSKHRKWWESVGGKIILTLLGAVVSGYIGFLVGVHIDVSTGIHDDIDTIKTRIASIDTCISTYHEAVQVATKNITYNNKNGMKCNVGINKYNPIFTVTVSRSYNPHNLHDDDKLIFLCVNKMNRSVYGVEAFVQLVDDSPESQAEFFLNPQMFQIMGINNPRGIYSLYFKKISQNKPQ